MRKTTKKIRALFVTINPIEHNRRLQNQINAALKSGWYVEVIAARSESALTVTLPVKVRITRLPLLARSGPLMFIGFNKLLVFLLVFRSYDVLFVRGVWPMPAVLFAKLFKKFRLIYDAHEYFAGLPSLQNRPLRRSLWLWLEKLGLKKSALALTVSEPILEQLRRRYPFFTNWQLIRNVPPFRQPVKAAERSDTEFRLVYHGYFMPERGLENLLQALARCTNKSIRLTLIGDGVLKNTLQQICAESALTERVRFMEMQPMDRLFALLPENDLGIVMLLPVSDNHRYALPNKFFDYLMAGLPVLASNILTMQNYITRYEVGITVDPQNPAAIADLLDEIADNRDILQRWRKNCIAAAKELCWENEEVLLRRAFDHLFT